MRFHALFGVAIGQKSQIQGPVALLTGRYLRYPLRRKMSRSQSPSGDYNEEYLYDVHVTAHRVKCLITKPTRCTNFSNLFLE